MTIVYSQVSDPSFAHSARDGFHRRAHGVQQCCQLPGPFRSPALLHDEPGHGDHIGVEGSLVGHDCRWSPEAWEWRLKEVLQDLNGLQCGTWSGGSEDAWANPEQQERCGPAGNTTRFVQTELG